MASVPANADIGAPESDPKRPVSDDSDGEHTTASTNSSVPSDKETTKAPSAPKIAVKRHRTLKDRAKVPPGMVLTITTVLSLLYSSGFIATLATNVVPGLYASLSFVATDIQQKFLGTFSLLKLQDTCSPSSQLSIHKILTTSIVTAVLGSIFYVLIIKPFRAGMWTGVRARRHVLHRYMGLLFLIQYAAAWYEFIVNYEGTGKKSYLPVTVALNGIIQATSAYFSFKVLPDLNDAGFYSDRAVLSRNFVFENCFFQLMTMFGSIYYNDALRTQLQSSVVGQALEIAFCFFPYVVIRTWFPITRFKDAGTSMSGRSKANERFYQIGTYMVKFFYLWAKYFLGFFINWFVFLGSPTPTEMRFIRGLFLLNGGTISIAVFLHTLRFKKVLPPRLMFSIYLAQIYATFLAIPCVYVMFTTNPKLAALTFAGLLCNMTRSRKIHAIWCCSSFALMKLSNIEW